MKNIYFFASFGRFDHIPSGGGQTAARRLWHTLEKLGYNVQLYNRHRYYWLPRPWNKLSILLFELLDPIWMFFVLIFKKRNDSMFLFMSYAGGLVYFDMLMTLVAKLSGHKAVMYLAGGMAQNYYSRKGCLYKWTFRNTMKMYDLVMCEGEVNEDLVDRITESKTKTFYLPNFTEDGFAPDPLPKKPMDCVNIFYFGRIDAEKNVLLGVDVFNILASTFENVYFTIVGGGDDAYDAKVCKSIEMSPYKDRIRKIGRSTHEQLAEMMKNQHIYLFPSAEPCEGHSNALNEAMSWGLVPVVSSNNFLPSIVGDSELVVNGYNAEDYANKIINLTQLNKIEQKSKQMYQRVKDNFTQKVIEKKLQKILNQV